MAVGEKYDDPFERSWMGDFSPRELCGDLTARTGHGLACHYSQNPAPLLACAYRSVTGEGGLHAKRVRPTAQHLQGPSDVTYGSGGRFAPRPSRQLEKLQHEEQASGAGERPTRAKRKRLTALSSLG